MTTAERMTIVENYLEQNALVDTRDKNLTECVAFYCAAPAIYAQLGSNSFDDIACAIRNAYLNGYEQHEMDTES